jgi:small subunit ribosomal protein S17e
LGNVRTEQIKRTANELMKRFPEKFSDNFDSNKLVVGSMVDGLTVKVRNQIAGYITRSFHGMQNEADEEEAEEIIGSDDEEEENK